MSVDPKRTAVILIEYQNDFTSEGGALHEVMSSDALAEQLRSAPTPAAATA